jgi:hypothetical protein
LEILKGFQSFSPALPKATLGNRPANPSTLKELNNPRSSVDKTLSGFLISSGITRRSFATPG